MIVNNCINTPKQFSTMSLLAVFDTYAHLLLRNVCHHNSFISNRNFHTEAILRITYISLMFQPLFINGDLIVRISEHPEDTVAT